MSDLLLNSVAQHVVEDKLEVMIDDYNNPDLTLKGKKEVLQMALLEMFLRGYNFGIERKDNGR